LRRGRLLTVALLSLSAACWWATTQAELPMAAAAPAFLLSWLTMMAAMMLPAVLPAVRLYARASKRTAAPTPFFLAGYLLVWTSLGVPAYLAWRQLMPRAMDGDLWVGRLAGATLLLAALYQVTPLKDACLARCRSPLGLFLRVQGSLRRPLTAVRLGAQHATFCVGCCWAFMVVLVAVGVMEPLWMAAIAALVFVEKALPGGERAVRPIALLLALAGAVLLLAPQHLSALTSS
jgi:predicted metal-binding membrane protein